MQLFQASTILSTAICGLGLLFTNTAATSTPDPYNYRNVTSTYVAPVPSNTTTLLNFIKSRSDLSSLLEALEQCEGFPQAFDTNPTWKFTFFAPSNEAFAETGRYFSTLEGSPEGKWWLGNVILNHYVPNSILDVSAFNETYRRFQAATFLYVGAQVVNGNVTLNKVSTVVEGDLAVTGGVVHIIDRILDPSAQIYEPDLPQISQAFIPGSCSNPALAYC